MQQAVDTVDGNRLTRRPQQYSLGGWGYYTDQASRFVQIENNIATGTKCGGFHQVGLLCEVLCLCTHMGGQATCQRSAR